MSGTAFTVVAIVAAYNEGDVIGQVLTDLIDQGVNAYLIDNASTDDTASRAVPYLGRGLLGIERFPPEGGEAATVATKFSWEAILKRKEVLAAELEADWFIHHDADELRESPWAHLNLRDAIRTVERLGYNAIDFELLNFWPTHDRFRPGDDLRAAFSHYSPGDSWDKAQIKCWKKMPHPVDLASSGGHEAIFPERRVFPLRFLLRHYAIRGQAHGERKVFHERRGRFLETERARGWHVQYDAFRRGQTFLRDPATMIPYDPDTVRWRLILRHRDVERLEEAVAAERLAREEASQELEKLQAQFVVRSHEFEQLQEELASRARRVMDLEALIEAVKIEKNRELQAVYSTRSWRWTAPLRAAFRLLARGR